VIQVREEDIAAGRWREPDVRPKDLIVQSIELRVRDLTRLLDLLSEDSGDGIQRAPYLLDRVVQVDAAAGLARVPVLLVSQEGSSNPNFYASHPNLSFYPVKHLVF